MKIAANALDTIPMIPINDLDNEWLRLILEAKQLGITKEEIREFLLCEKTIQ